MPRAIARLSRGDPGLDIVLAAGLQVAVPTGHRLAGRGRVPVTSTEPTYAVRAMVAALRTEAARIALGPATASREDASAAES